MMLIKRKEDFLPSTTDKSDSGTSNAKAAHGKFDSDYLSAGNHPVKRIN